MTRYDGSRRELTENEIARIVVDAAFKIHSRYGPGLLESAYRAMLEHELEKRGLAVLCEQPIRLVYDGKDVWRCRRLTRTQRGYLRLPLMPSKM